MPDFDRPPEREYTPEERRKNAELEVAAKEGRQNYLRRVQEPLATMYLDIGNGDLLKVTLGEGGECSSDGVQEIVDKAQLVACDPVESL